MAPIIETVAVALGIYLMVGMVFAAGMISTIEPRLRAKHPEWGIGARIALVLCFLQWTANWLPIVWHYWRRR